MTSDAEKKLACLVCRHRKVACDRRRPKCGLCEKCSFDCQYKARDHRPGLRAGYVSQLEKRVECLESRMDAFMGQQLAQERSRNIEPSHGAYSLDHQAPRLGCSSVEPMSPPQPNDLRLTHDDSYTAIPSPGHANGSFNYQHRALWLQKYHPWFPILHHTSVAAASSLPGQSLVQKAIVAATVWYVPEIPIEQKLSQSEAICQDVILKAMASSGLVSVQALLIVAILCYGEGKWPQCSNLIAMCKRMSQQLGMATIAGVTGVKPSQRSVENVETFGTNMEIDREERIRAFWMTEMLDSIFALGSASNYSAPPVPLAVNLPCSDTAWALQDPFRGDVPAQNVRYSSGFSMCISLCTAELGEVHRFQQTVRECSDMAGGLEWQSAAQRLDERLTIWREEFVAAVFRLINTESPQDPRAEMGPFIVLTNCVLNMAVIAFLQSQTSLPAGIGAESEPWPYANHRCMYTCENMAAKIRRMEEDELQNCSPCLILPMFVAARFYIVHTKCLHADVSVNLHSLAYSLHICSRRWPLAKVFECVIRTAVAEHRTPLPESALPVEFYDLRYSVIEISDILQNWTGNVSSPLGNL